MPSLWDRVPPMWQNESLVQMLQCCKEDCCDLQSQYHTIRCTVCRCDQKKNRHAQWRMPLWVQNLPIRFKIDTGSQVNIIPWSLFKKISSKLQLKQTKTKLISYTGDNVMIAGACNMNCGGKTMEVSMLSRYHKLGIVPTGLSSDQRTVIKYPPPWFTQEECHLASNLHKTFSRKG